jgi:hypothetical protein
MEQVLCNYENNGCDIDRMSESIETYLKKAKDNLYNIIRKDVKEHCFKYMPFVTEEVKSKILENFR